MLFEQPFEPELDGQQAVALGADRQWTVVGGTVLGQRPLVAFQDRTGDLGRSGQFPFPTPVAKPPQAVMSEFDGGWGEVAVGQGVEKGITQGGNRGRWRASRRLPGVCAAVRRFPFVKIPLSAIPVSGWHTPAGTNEELSLEH